MVLFKQNTFFSVFGLLWLTGGTAFYTLAAMGVIK